jgi:dihydrodipicolinate synthase/N-acetylneuraminate lyase
MAEESRWVRYIKVESIPPAAKVADAVAQAGDILTIFGGAGGGYFIEEMRRGSVGTMPFCSQPEAFVEVWDHFQSGDQAGARATFDRVIAPINRVSAQATGAYYHVNKELLRQRGIIATAHVRHPSGPPLDDLTRRELQAIIDELYGAGASA